jgi:hypothetical protein
MSADDSRIHFAINNFTALESQLTECMEFIPFVEQNQRVLSPRFIPIILEACSLTESTLKSMTDVRARIRGFKRYAEVHEEHLQLEDAVTIFLATPMRFLRPYEGWTRVVPEWWNAYNRLKHDRLDNYEYATYNTSVSSLAALHLLIAKCRLFTDHLVKAGWFNPSGDFIPELICARIAEAGIPIRPIPCETNLFVSPLGTNFVSLDGGFPSIDECDFSDRLKLLLTMSGYY